MTWEATPAPGGWVYEHSDSAARIIVDYIIPKGTTWEAWVECRDGSEGRPLASGTVNISSPSASRPFLQTIGETNIPWADGLLTAFYDTVQAEREGATTQDLALIEPEAVTFLIEPLVELGGNTRIIAPGGSGKSFLSLAMGLTVATGNRKFLGLSSELTGPVLYLDWETNAATHARRIEQLREAADAPKLEKGMIFYRFEALPLFRTMQTVSRFCEKEGVVMVIVDSRQTAAGASGQSSGEEAALNLHTALREIGRPSVLVDHKAKENIEKGRKGGYGSVWNTNLARMEWEFTKYQRLGPEEHLFAMTLEKGNNVGRLPPLGYRLSFAGGLARFTRVKPETIDDPTATDSLAEKIAELFDVSSEPMPVSKIADMTGENDRSVRSALNRDPRFVNVAAGKGKKGQWRVRDEYLNGPRDDGIQQQLEEYEEVPDEVEEPLPDPPDDVEVF